MGDTPLDRLDRQVRERYKKEEKKVVMFHTQREVERTHSRLIRPELCTFRQAYKPDLLKACTPHKTMEKIYKCDIVNCGIAFNDRQLYNEHKTGNRHSPCNPLKHLINGRLQGNLTSHLCSECGCICRNYESCVEHMSASGHNFLQIPLRLAGYACPQCLSVFDDKTSCVNHMDSLKHCYIQYPFKDDLEQPLDGGPAPVPLPKATLELFMEKCAAVSYTYTCQKCEQTTELAHVHDKKRACADLSHGEVLASLMKSHTCVLCLRLFDNICQKDLELGLHYCTADSLGLYIDNDCKRFSEFVRRLALPVQDIENDIPEVRSEKGNSDDVVLENKSSTHEVMTLGDSVAVSEYITSTLNLPQITSVNKELKSIHISEGADICSKAQKRVHALKDAIPFVKKQKVSSCASSPETAEQKSAMSSPGHRRAVEASNTTHRVMIKAQHPKCTAVDTKSVFFNVAKCESQNPLPVEDQKSSTSKRCKSLDNQEQYLSKMKRQRVEEMEFSEYSQTQSKQQADSMIELKTGTSTSSPDYNEIATTEEQKHDKFQTDDNHNILPQSALSHTQCMDGVHEKPNGGDLSSSLDPISKEQRKRNRNRVKRQNRKLRKQFASCSLQQSNAPWGVPRFNFTPANNNHQWTPFTNNYQWRPYSNLNLSQPRNTTETYPKNQFVKPHNVHKHQPAAASISTSTTGTDSRYNRNKNNLKMTIPQTIISHDPVPQSPRLILSDLRNMQHIIFLDLDNWVSFFQKLPEFLPAKTFVWAFYGGCTAWKEPTSCLAYLHSKQNQCFYLHKKCSGRKDAADFAICMWIGRMDERLPKSIPFTILSGDGGFKEIEEQMKMSERRTRVVNPHHQDAQIVYALIKSVADV